MSTRSKRTRGDAAAAATAASAAASTQPDAHSAAAAPAESAPGASAAAAPRSTKKKSKSKQQQEEEEEAAVEPVPMEDVQSARSVSGGGGGWSVESLLAGVGGRQVAEDSTEAAAQMRTLQQAILKQANSRASDLLHPDLWPSFLARLERLQANTVRLDVHLLPAISRTAAEMFAALNRDTDAPATADPFALMPTLQRMVQLLLPCDSTPVSQSWATTFHPNYELLSTFLFALMRLLLAQAALHQGSGLAALPASVFRFMSAVLASFTLVNAGQNAQRKVYEQALQERNLPVWAMLHQALLRQLQAQRSASPNGAAAATRDCATRVEQLIGGVLFHPEHLGLYADALGMDAKAAQEDDSSDEEEEEEEQAEAEAEAEADANKEKEEEAAEGSDSESKESSDKPAVKKAKLDAGGKSARSQADKDKSKGKQKGKSAGPNKLPQPNNYTNKLFETIQRWINREEQTTDAAAAPAPAPAADTKAAGGKKRKAAETAESDAAPAPAAATSSSASVAPFSSRAIRAVLPLLFGGYVRASEAAFHALYPPAGSRPSPSEALPFPGAAGASDPHHSGVLSPLEMRRKKSRERMKGQQELRFLQKMWQLNENAPVAAPAAGASAGTQREELVSPLFSAPLTARSLPLLHDMFATNARLFQLVHAHDIYKINQDANVSGSSAASFTGLKKILADQMHQVMAVARSLIVQSQVGEAASSKKKSRKSAAPSSSTSSGAALSGAELLALSIPLASNILHLLQLNPEFIIRYLYVRTTKQSSKDTLAVQLRDVNVWHLVWKVIELHARLGRDAQAEVPAVVASLSSPRGALSSIRALSQAIFLSFSKLRQHDVLFSSYVHAARTAAALDPRMVQAPFATVNGPRFQLVLLMRNIPPLKVPALWEWFLAQCALHTDEDDDESERPSRAATETLLHFFVFFLDSMLVREEIALQLQALFTRTVQRVIAAPLTEVLQDHLRLSQSKSGASTASSASSSLPLSSLLLLLHSLNDVKAQCDQHTSKTYETMMAPLPSYFHPIDEYAAGEGAGAGALRARAIRLTEVIDSLSHAAESDPALLYSLHLLSLQRLHQLYRFQQRNIVTNLFENDAAAGDEETSDEDMDSDDEAASNKKAKKASNGDLPKRASQTHAQESEALASFLLSKQSTCACYTAPNASAHAQFQWDGAAASLAGAGEGAAAVALWHLLAGNLDVLAHFASQEQRRQLVAHVFAISACAHCHAAAGAGAGAGEGGVTASPSSSSTGASLHTLRSITTSLFTQPWVYEIASLRSVLMDVAASRLIDTAALMHAAMDKSVRKAAGAAPAPTPASVTLPAEFVLTAALDSKLNVLRQFAQYAASAPASSSAGAGGVSAQMLWECIWLLQLLHSFPSQYFLVQPQFHALLVQLTWAIESLCSALSVLVPTPSKSKSKAALVAEPKEEPESLVQIARNVSESDPATLLSHLVLSSRRMMLSSLSALSSSSSSTLSSLVSAPLLEWVCWATFNAGALRGRHVVFAREATRRCVNILAPALLARQKGQQAKIDKEEEAAAVAAAVAAASGDKKKSKSDKAAATAATAPVSALLPVVEHIHAAMQNVSSSSVSAAGGSDAVWCLQLASSLVDAFVPGWDAPIQGGSSNAATDALGRHFRTVRDAPLVFQVLQRLGRTLREKLLPLVLTGADRGVGASSKEEDELLGAVLDLHARLLVNLFAYKASMSDKEKTSVSTTTTPTTEAKLDSSLLGAADSALHVAVEVLTSGNGSRTQSARMGAVTFVQALCVILPLFQSAESGSEGSASSSISFATLMQSVSRISVWDASARLGLAAAGVKSAPATVTIVGVVSSSSLTVPIQSAWASLMSHASEKECAQMVDLCLAQLDPCFARALPLDEEDQDNALVPGVHAKLAGGLQLLLVYIQHMQSSSQRRAVGHAHLSLLLYRLASLSSEWVGEYLSRARGAGACVSLAGSALALLAHVLSRHQVFVLDDSALAMLAHTLSNVAVMLRDSFPRQQRGGRGAAAAAATAAVDASSVPEANVSASALYHPLYLSLYALLKFHPSATIKIVPVYLATLRVLMEHQWRQIQHTDPASSTAAPVPVSVSENLARVLEEMGRPTNAKLFNKYAVGLLLEWINLSKHKGAAWGHASQEAHVRAVHKGLFAIIAVCEEHDLAQLNNLLDVAGRTIFRTLHQAYKKTRFTGLV